MVNIHIFIYIPFSRFQTDFYPNYSFLFLRKRSRPFLKGNVPSMFYISCLPLPRGPWFIHYLPFSSSHTPSLSGLSSGRPLFSQQNTKIKQKPNNWKKKCKPSMSPSASSYCHWPLSFLRSSSDPEPSLRSPMSDIFVAKATFHFTFFVWSIWLLPPSPSSYYDTVF